MFRFIHFIKAAFWLLIPALLFACAPEEQVHLAIPAPVQSVSASQVIGAGDVLAIIVDGEDDLGGSYTVGENGTVRLPLVGDVPVVDMTDTQAQDAITKAYGNGYLVAPKVRVEKQAQPAVFVMGAVNNPGSYLWRKGLTIMEAGASAGGLKAEADLRYFDVIRQGQKISSGVSSLAEPGDVIIVKGRELP